MRTDSPAPTPRCAPSGAATAREVPRFVDLANERPLDPRREIAESLGAPVPFIAPKFFYDRLGSALFSAICELPEYYPTRTEAAIFDAHAAEIADAVGAQATLIDLGAGDCAKAARLFDGLAPAQYVAVDISVEFVRDAVERLQRQFPSLPMLGIGTDFSKRLRLASSVHAARRVFFYAGSSIGNFTPAQAHEFLSGLRTQVDAAGGLLLGVDLAKPREIVEPAYDDALGITAAFNLNVLCHVNRLLGSDFDVADWRHVAFLNERESRIEMHLEARRDLDVAWPGGGRRFGAGERIHTENSYKHRRADVEAMLDAAGFVPCCCWTDANEWFALFFARPGTRDDGRGEA